MGGECSKHGDVRNPYSILVGKPEGKRPRCRWEENIIINLTETG